MKNRILPLLLLCLQTTTLLSQREFREIVLSGTGYERGLQHGRQLKREIAEIVELWKLNTSASEKKDADSILRDFFEYAQFTDTIRRTTPDLYDEVRGIADGSGQALEDIFVLNLLDEFWIYLDRLENHHCSGLGVPSVNGKPAYVAQNMDLEKYTDGFQVMVRIPRQGEQPEQLILTHAGLLALNGMNEAGVAVCVNAMMDLNASHRGLPVAFFIRSIISRSSKEDILTFIHGVSHASGQNYIIAVGDEVFDFEASANKVVQFKPENPHGAVYHTNHAIVNEDIKPWHLEPSESRSNSAARLEAVARRMSDVRLLEDAAKDALRSKDNVSYPVCRQRQDDQSFFTFASTIMTLSDKPFFQVTFGPPDESRYRVVNFSNH